MTDGSHDSRPVGRAKHVPVLAREALRSLQLQPGATVVDGTVGAGGHSRQILKLIGETGTLIGLDRDPLMLRLAAEVLQGDNVVLRQASYAELPDVIRDLGLAAVDRILLDLGLSSDQLADAGRGFSFESHGSLDLRFDPTQGAPAWQLLARVSEAELQAIFERYGEEPHSRNLARELVARRQTDPIRTAADLAEVVQQVAGGRSRAGRKHPATRAFQALRIAVNDELDHLARALDVLGDCLEPGGILVVITFHSLEDRLVKRAFRSQERWQNLTPKPLTASTAETRVNPRSRTAKLRSACRI